MAIISQELQCHVIDTPEANTELIGVNLHSNPSPPTFLSQFQTQTMKIKDLKQPYKALALVRQKEHGNEPNEDVGLSVAFAPIGAKESSFWWLDVERGLYPPIPPDSLKDIPLQVRWDSGERFRARAGDLAKIKDLRVFNSGEVAYVYEDGSAYFGKSESYFLEYFEPIPSEPQTRWVNVYLGDSKDTTCFNVTTGDVDLRADKSFQQQLINSKWVNV